MITPHRSPFWRSHALLLGPALCLILGVGLRFTGLTRGSADLPGDDQSPTEFFAFHPDETMVLDAARVAIDPLDPPFTVYGLLPVYLLRAALLALPGGIEESSVATLYLVARLLAALISCISLLATFLIGRRTFGPVAASLATLGVAVAPGVIQQGHFYIVDGLFGLLSLLTLAAVLRVRSSTGTWPAILAGGLIGATAAVKLTGLLLGPVLLLALVHGRQDEGAANWRALLGAIRDRRLWLAAAATVTVLLACEPYLITTPERLFRDETVADFATSAAIADGRYLRAWTLFDVHTPRYLHHWTHLMPLIAGLPLTLLLGAGLLAALWRRSPAHFVLASWFVLYFALIGSLHAKHVRYMVPLFPPLALLAGDLARRMCSRYPGILLCAGIYLWTTAYGIAFAAIYVKEDSRLQATRWVRDHVEAGSRIVVETGGFTMSGPLAAANLRTEPLYEMLPLATRGYLTCESTWTHLRGRLQTADYLVIVDANRYLQFTAVPDLLPAASSFYERLLSGELGFTRIEQFAEPVQFAGIDFRHPRPETSFIGYDHPTVIVLQQQPDAAIPWERWRTEMSSDQTCPDRVLQPIVTAIKSGDHRLARMRADEAIAAFPDNALAWLLLAFTQQQVGQSRAVGVSMSRFRNVSLERSHTPFMAPVSAALSMTQLGMPALARAILRDGHQFVAPGFEAKAVIAYEWLGSLLTDLGDPATAAAAYETALRLAPQDRSAQISLAWTQYLLGDLAQAISLNEKILRDGLDSVPLFNLGLALLAAGDSAAASERYAEAVRTFGPEEGHRTGAVLDLQTLADSGPRADAARHILQRHWPQPGPAEQAD